MESLPTGPLFEIATYLTLQEKCRCAQVCRNFKQLFYQTALYTEIDLNLFKQQIEDESLEFLSSRLKNTRILSLRGCKLLTTRSLDIIMEHCQDLQILNLKGCMFPPDENLIIAPLQKWKPALAIQHNLKIDHLFASFHDGIADLILSASNCIEMNDPPSRHQLGVSTRAVAVHIGNIIQSLKTVRRETNTNSAVKLNSSSSDTISNNGANNQHINRGSTNNPPSQNNNTTPQTLQNSQTPNVQSQAQITSQSTQSQAQTSQAIQTQTQTQTSTTQPTQTPQTIPTPTSQLHGIEQAHVQQLSRLASEMVQGIRGVMMGAGGQDQLMKTLIRFDQKLSEIYDRSFDSLA